MFQSEINTRFSDMFVADTSDEQQSHNAVGSLTSNIFESQQSFAVQEYKEYSLSESEIISVESSQDNSRYSEDLIFATLVDSDRTIFDLNFIMDAISVDDQSVDGKSIPWYKDRRTLLMLFIAIIVTAAVTVPVTVLLLNERNDNDPCSCSPQC